MRKTRRLAVILLGVVFGLCGCGKKKVDYNPDKDIETSTNTDSDGNGNYVGGLKKALHVEDEILENFASEAGEEMVLRGKVSVPDVNSVSTYDIKALPFDVARRDEFIAHFSDDGKMYSLELEDLPKEMLREKIAEEEAMYERMKNSSYENPEDLDAEMELINDLYRMLENATDEYKESTANIGKFGDYQHCSFLTIKDNVRYYCMAQEELLYAWPDNWLDIYPELKENYVLVHSMEYSADSFQGTEEEREKIVSVAVSFTKEFGISGLVVNDVGVNKLSARPISGGDTVVLKGDYGYVVSLSREADGVPMDNHSYHDMVSYASLEEMQNGHYESSWGREDMMLLLSPDLEILGISYLNPMTNPEVLDSNVELLDYSSIKEIIIKELARDPLSKYNYFDSEGKLIDEKITRYKNITFEYFMINNPDKKGTFTLIPVWCVEGDTMDSSFYGMFFNAMDGSRIDPAKETMDYIDNSNFIKDEEE